jgi:glutamate racemase
MRALQARSIGVIATESTVNSGAYSAAIRKADPNAEVIERACPLFVPLAEEGWSDNEVAKTIAATYLSDLRSKVDTLVLGCTHYPLLTSAIARVLKRQIMIVDSAHNCARAVEEMLDRQSLRAAPSNNGKLHVALTDAADSFLNVARDALQLNLGKIEIQPLA